MSDTKTFWAIFLKDPANGVIHGTVHGHNATGDYISNPYYTGTYKIKVPLKELGYGR